MIVGPHGSGKSTLLEHMVPELGRLVWRSTSTGDEPSAVPVCDRSVREASVSTDQVIWLSFRREFAPWRQVQQSRPLWKRGSLLVVDGWEQLLGWHRWLLARWTHCRRMGLLSTSHRKHSGIPVLCQTSVRSQDLQPIVSRLLDGHAQLSAEYRQQLCDPRMLDRLLREEHGNLREVFMRLYDHFEVLADHDRSAAKLKLPVHCRQVD